MTSNAEDFVDRLVKVNRKMRTMFDARAKAQGLTLSRARLVMALAREDGQTQTQLAQALEVEQPSIVGLVDALEKKGLVERRAEDPDRRAKRVHLTDAAHDEAVAFLAYAETLRAEILEGVPPDDIEIATRVLDRVLTNIAGG